MWVIWQHLWSLCPLLKVSKIMGPFSRRVLISLVFFLSFLPRDSVFLYPFLKKTYFFGKQPYVLMRYCVSSPRMWQVSFSIKETDVWETVRNIPRHLFSHRDVDETFSQDGDVVELEIFPWESGSNRKQLSKKFRGCWKSLWPSSEISFSITVLLFRLRNI